MMKLLPPGLSGEAQFILTLTVDEIIWNGNELKDNQIRAVWWGEELADAIFFSPVNITDFSQVSEGGVLFVRYQVATSREKFIEYLADASPLRLSLQHIGENRELGFCLVEDLVKVGRGEDMDGYYPIISSDNHDVVLANLRVKLQLNTPEEIKKQDEAASKKPASQAKPKVTLKSKQQTKSKPAGQTGQLGGDTAGSVGNTVFAKPISESTTQRAAHNQPNKNRLTGTKSAFSPRQAASQPPQVSSNRGTSALSSREPRVTFVDGETVGATGRWPLSASTAPIADSLLSELLNQSRQLRESMQYLLPQDDEDQNLTQIKAVAHSNVTRKTTVPSRVPNPAINRPQLKSSTAGKSDTNIRNAADNAIVSPRSPRRGKENLSPKNGNRFNPQALGVQLAGHKFPANSSPTSADSPAWNLSIPRMKYLAKVTQIVLNLDSVVINQSIFNMLQQHYQPKRSAKSPASRGSRNPQLSYFLKMELPGGDMEESVCTRKSFGNVIDFSERLVKSVIFNSKMVDDWWKHVLAIRLYSRKLNQRTPLHLATANIGLKYLLMHDSNSNGSKVSLPMYLSHSLLRELKLPPTTTEEIVGTLELSFQFQSTQSASNRDSQDLDILFNGRQDRKPQHEENNPQYPMRGDSRPKDNLVQYDIVTDNHTERPDVALDESDEKIESIDLGQRSSRIEGWISDQSVLRTTIKSRPQMFEGRQGSTIISRRPEGDPASFFTPVSFHQSVLLNLKISSFRESTLVIKYRNFEGTELKVDLSKEETLCDTIPLFLPGKESRFHNRQMLSRLLNNFLVFESWSDGVLIGIARIPTDSLYHTFKHGNVTGLFRCWDGPVEVYSIYENAPTGYPIQVSVYAGSQQDIARLLSTENIPTKLTSCSSTSETNSRKIQKDLLPLDNKEEHCSTVDDVSHAAVPNAKKHDPTELAPSSPGRGQEMGVQTSFIFPADRQPTHEAVEFESQDLTNDNAQMEMEVPTKDCGNGEGQPESDSAQAHEPHTIVSARCSDEVYPHDPINETTFEEDHGQKRTTVAMEIKIEEGRNLPLLKAPKSKDQNGGQEPRARFPPNCYATLSSSLTTLPGHQLETETCVGLSPAWRFATVVQINTDLITDVRQHLIVKVWHQIQPHIRDKKKDQVLGFAAVDLCPLILDDFNQLSGWYNISNCWGACRGQLKVTITPQESLDLDPSVLLEAREAIISTSGSLASNYIVHGGYAEFPSHMVQHTEQIISSAKTLTDSREHSITEHSTVSNIDSRDNSRIFWNPTRLGENLGEISDNTTSFLERKLETKLSELDALSSILNNLQRPAHQASSDNNSSDTGKTFVIGHNQSPASTRTGTYTLTSPAHRDQTRACAVDAGAVLAGLSQPSTVEHLAGEPDEPEDCLQTVQEKITRNLDMIRYLSQAETTEMTHPQPKAYHDDLWGFPVHPAPPPLHINRNTGCLTRTLAAEIPSQLRQESGGSPYPPREPPAPTLTDLSHIIQDLGLEEWPTTPAPTHRPEIAPESSNEMPVIPDQVIAAVGDFQDDASTSGGLAVSDPESDLEQDDLNRTVVRL